MPTHYRYKRPPRKRKSVPLEGPTIVKRKAEARPLVAVAARTMSRTPIRL